MYALFLVHFSNNSFNVHSLPFFFFPTTIINYNNFFVFLWLVIIFKLFLLLLRFAAMLIFVFISFIFSLSPSTLSSLLIFRSSKNKIQFRNVWVLSNVFVISDAHTAFIYTLHTPCMACHIHICSCFSLFFRCT